MALINCNQPMDNNTFTTTFENRTWKQSFRWAAGIEGSVIPHLGIDQFEWTQHDRRWREDLTLAAQDLQCKWLRYSLVWGKIEPEPGRFDWSWVDERLELANELSLKFILDLVHFGVPQWLPGAFGDIEFPAALERLATAFGSRYAGHPAIPSICPINEPLTTAFFSGDAGLWPPYARGLASYMRIVANLVQGFCRATRALRQTMPEIEIILCDSLEVAVTQEPDSSERTSPHLRESLGTDVARRMERRHVIADLIMGLVTKKHPLRHWLMSHGFLPSDLEWLSQNKQQIDVIGLDYYDHTEVEIFTTPEGHYRQRTNPNPIGLHRAAQAYWHRYHLPFMITETSAVGPIDRRLNWLNTCVDAVRKLRRDGFPCIGYTWWPLFDHLDWDGAMLHRTGHIHPVGLYALERLPDGELARKQTELTNAYRKLIAGGDQPVGSINLSQIEASRIGRSVHRKESGYQPIPTWPLIIYGSQPWNGPRQRQHHLAIELQRRHSTLFIEREWIANHLAPQFALISEDSLPHLWRLSIGLPYRMQSNGAECDSETKRLLDEAFETQLPPGEFVQATRLVYDADLFYSSSPGIDHGNVVYEFHGSGQPLSHGRESQLLESATWIVTRNESAIDTINSRDALSHISDGVDAKHFLRSRRSDVTVPHDISFIGRPIVGMFGTIDERVDIDLIMKLVETEQCNVLVIGPVRGGVIPENLPRRVNLFWIGYRPYERLSAYAAAVDCWIVPYKVDRLSPKKIREYLMTGRPVVSAALPGLDSSFGRSVRIARTPDAFVALCLEAIQNPATEDRRPVMLELARRRWSKVAQEVEDVINRARDR
jgi:beta-glucosidase